VRDSTMRARAPSVDRKRFLLGTAGALTGVGLAGAGAATASAATAGAKLAAAPNPIPGGIDTGGPPFDTIHVYLPGPGSITLPFSGIVPMGLDVEPTTPVRGEQPAPRSGTSR
jgi:hypothetical protein